MENFYNKLKPLIKGNKTNSYSFNENHSMEIRIIRKRIIELIFEKDTRHKEIIPIEGKRK